MRIIRVTENVTCKGRLEELGWLAGREKRGRRKPRVYTSSHQLCETMLWRRLLAVSLVCRKRSCELHSQKDSDRILGKIFLREGRAL